MAEFRPVNLAEIYGQIDAARANQANMENNRMMQERQRRQFAMEDEALAEQRALRDVYRGAVNDVDGMPQLDEKRLLSDLYRVAPEKALAQQEAFGKRDAEKQKLQIEAQKAELAKRVETSKYLRDLMPSVTDQQSYEAFLQEAQAVGANGILQSAPREFNPKWVESNMYTSGDFIKKAEAELNRGVTMRGQDITMRGQDLSRDTAIRGQDISAATARRGQDITLRGQNLTDARAVASQNKPAAKTPLSATAQKELFEADEMVQASRNALGMLREAKRLNQTAYSGIGAKPRAVIASNLGMGAGGADDTINLDNLMTGQALESLKATFGGMPTEGERKILLDIQASADKTPAQRKSILERAEQAAQRRIKFNEKKANALRSGTYFTEQQQAPIEVAPTRDVRSEADKILGL